MHFEKFLPNSHHPESSTNVKLNVKAKPTLTALLPLAVTLLALAGCSSTPTKVDHGPIRARTFSFVTRDRAVPDYADGRQVVHTMIQNAITKNLGARGLTKTEQGGDVTVAYLLIVGNNAVTTSVNDYFGYGEDAAALQNKAHKAYTGSKNPNYFEAGTLLIDIIDSKTFKLLQRHYVTRPVLRDLNDDARAARIQETVDQILAEVQVQP
jgi:hypothetical protein